MIKKILSLSLILLTLLAVSAPDTLAAANPNFGENITISKDEVINGPYFNAGNNVTISGTVEGDVYLAGGVVNVDGTINGDLFIGGGVITVTGKVSDDVRVGGGMVTIDGEIGKNVTALGGTVTIGTNAQIGKSLIALGGNTLILGKVSGGAHLYSNEVVIGGTVEANTKITAEKITVAKTAILNGSLTYTAADDAEISEQAAIAGPVSKKSPEVKLPKVAAPARRATSVLFGFKTLSYFGLLLVGFVLLKAAPRQTIAVAKLIGKRPWKSLGWGFLGVTLTPALALLLALTVIGIPLAVVVFGIYALMIALSSLFTGLFVGQRVFDLINLKENRYLMLATGLLLLQLIFILPVAGFFARLLSLFFALGAMLVWQKDREVSKL